MMRVPQTGRWWHPKEVDPDRMIDQLVDEVLRSKPLPRPAREPTAEEAEILRLLDEAAARD